MPCWNCKAEKKLWPVCKKPETRYRIQVLSAQTATSQKLQQSVVCKPWGYNPATQAMMQGQVAGQMTPTKAVNNSGGY